MPIELRVRDWGEHNGRLVTGRTQRLIQKPESDFHARLSQVFGNGMTGLSEEAWQVLQQVFDLDSMGAAEYEFGAIPNCIRSMIAKVADYEGFTFVIKAKDIKSGMWRDRALDVLRRKEITEARNRGEPAPRLNKKRLMERMKEHPLTDRTIYVYAPSGDNNRRLVIGLIQDVADGRFYIKNGARMYLDPNPSNEYEQKIKGWLDLDNELFWFLDEEMWKGTLKIFGKEPP